MPRIQVLDVKRDQHPGRGWWEQLRCVNMVKPSFRCHAARLRTGLFSFQTSYGFGGPPVVERVVRLSISKLKQLFLIAAWSLSGLCMPMYANWSIWSAVQAASDIKTGHSAFHGSSGRLSHFFVWEFLRPESLRADHHQSWGCNWPLRFLPTWLRHGAVRCCWGLVWSFSWRMEILPFSWILFWYVLLNLLSILIIYWLYTDYILYSFTRIP